MQCAKSFRKFACLVIFYITPYLYFCILHFIIYMHFTKLVFCFAMLSRGVGLNIGEPLLLERLYILEINQHSISSGRESPQHLSEKQYYTHLDWNDGQFFVAMEWWWSYFPNDGMAMVFENFLPSPSMVFGGINHRQRWFFDGFAIFGNQWLTMVTEEKTRISRQTQIHNKLQVN